MQKISSLDDIHDPSYILFKHSSSCPISAEAHRAMLRAEQEIDLPVYLVVVQEERGLSDQIARDFGIAHESPQAMLVNEGTVRWHDSHYGINPDALKKAVEKLR